MNLPEIIREENENLGFYQIENIIKCELPLIYCFSCNLTEKCKIFKYRFPKKDS